MLAHLPTFIKTLHFPITGAAEGIKFLFLVTEFDEGERCPQEQSSNVLHRCGNVVAAFLAAHPALEEARFSISCWQLPEFYPWWTRARLPADELRAVPDRAFQMHQLRFLGLFGNAPNRALFAKGRFPVVTELRVGQLLPEFPTPPFTDYAAVAEACPMLESLLVAAEQPIAFAWLKPLTICSTLRKLRLAFTEHYKLDQDSVAKRLQLTLTELLRLLPNIETVSINHRRFMRRRDRPRSKSSSDHDESSSASEFALLEAPDDTCDAYSHGLERPRPHDEPARWSRIRYCQHTH